MVLSSVCSVAPSAEAYVASGFCVGTIPIATQLQRPRSIYAVGSTDFMILERGTSSIKIVEDLLNNDGIPDTIRTVVQFSGLNHGFVVNSKHLYASTSNDVYRWEYNPITKTVSTPTTPTKVITNMNNDGRGGTSSGGHTTRTLVWDDRNNALYVSVGAIGNIDIDSFRARIRRFVITNATTNANYLPIDYTTGEVFADGIRNEVAMELSPKTNELWGAGNSADQLTRPDLGNLIYNDNPAEELHRFSVSGENYGYPNCWREYILPSNVSKGRGTAWSWPTKNITDEYCRTNYVSPILAMQAHSAPLGLTFYSYTNNRPTECTNVIPFPKSMDGYLFIAFHGSWNRQIPTGYKVVYVPIASDGTSVIGGIGSNPIDLLRHDGTDARWSDGFRPVDVSFDTCGRLLVSSDGTSNTKSGTVVRIEYTLFENQTLVPTRTPITTTNEPSQQPSSPPRSLFQRLLSFLFRLLQAIFGGLQ